MPMPPHVAGGAAAATTAPDVEGFLQQYPERYRGAVTDALLELAVKVVRRQHPAGRVALAEIRAAGAGGAADVVADVLAQCPPGRGDPTARELKRVLHAAITDGADRDAVLRYVTMLKGLKGYADTAEVCGGALVAMLNEGGPWGGRHASGAAAADDNVAAWVPNGRPPPTSVSPVRDRDAIDSRAWRASLRAAGGAGAAAAAPPPAGHRNVVSPRRPIRGGTGLFTPHAFAKDARPTTAGRGGGRGSGINARPRAPPRPLEGGGAGVGPASRTAEGSRTVGSGTHGSGSSRHQYTAQRRTASYTVSDGLRWERERGVDRAAGKRGAGARGAARRSTTAAPTLSLSEQIAIDKKIWWENRQQQQQRHAPTATTTTTTTTVSATATAASTPAAPAPARERPCARAAPAWMVPMEVDDGGLPGESGAEGGRRCREGDGDIPPRHGPPGLRVSGRQATVRDERVPRCQAESNASVADADVTLSDHYGDDGSDTTPAAAAALYPGGSPVAGGPSPRDPRPLPPPAPHRHAAAAAVYADDEDVQGGHAGEVAAAEYADGAYGPRRSGAAAPLDTRRGHLESPPRPHAMQPPPAPSTPPASLPWSAARGEEGAQPADAAGHTPPRPRTAVEMLRMGFAMEEVVGAAGGSGNNTNTAAAPPPPRHRYHRQIQSPAVPDAAAGVRPPCAVGGGGADSAWGTSSAHTQPAPSPAAEAGAAAVGGAEALLASMLSDRSAHSHVSSSSGAGGAPLPYAVVAPQDLRRIVEDVLLQMGYGAGGGGAPVLR